MNARTSAVAVRQGPGRKKAKAELNKRRASPTEPPEPVPGGRKLAHDLANSLATIRLRLHMLSTLAPRPGQSEHIDAALRSVQESSNVLRRLSALME